jgi:hypothetical protein
MYRLVAVVECHTQTFVNTAMNSRGKFVARWATARFCRRGRPLRRNGERKRTENRYIPAWTVTGGQWHCAVPLVAGATVSGCGRQRFVVTG